MPDQPTLDPPPWSEAMFRALTEQSGDIISLLDDSGRLLYNSPAAEKISGFSTAELSGVDTFTFFHPDDRERVQAEFARVLATPGAMVTVEYRYRRKEGGWTWMEAVASNQLDNPDVRGVVTNSRDISERKQQQAQQHLIEEQQLHRQRLESLGTLAGGIAHDFNNLLSAIGMHVALAAATTGDAAVRAELEGAEVAVRRAAELTRQLLGFARRQPARPLTLDLRQALQHLGPLLERLLGGQIAVSLSVPEGPVWVGVDPAQLEQVLVNLATNARDAMPGGGHLQLRVALEPGGTANDLRPSVLLSVLDDGVGVAPDVLPRVFEPFFTTKELGRGTGLGLAVSHGIITQSGGSIWLESEPGTGTAVHVRLPLADPPTPPATAAVAAKSGAARPGERVLLADDDDLVRTVTARMLSRLGWAVDEARDGFEALERLVNAPTAYSAAVFDLRMPRLGGEEAAQQALAIDPNLPVLFISGYADGARTRTDIIQKPFDGPALGHHLRNAIDRARDPRLGPAIAPCAR
ncbi:MAG: PAS domain S-box protein [Deltaproteobacteria bacterium]|nr:PAS domain S-box protein [Deltaproteobacteria bacterium]